MCEIREVNHVNEDSEDFGFFGIFGIFEKLEFTLDVVESQSTKIKRTLKQISYLFTFDNLCRWIFSIYAVGKINRLTFKGNNLVWQKTFISKKCQNRGWARPRSSSWTIRNLPEQWPTTMTTKAEDLSAQGLLVFNFVCFVFLKCF